MPQFIQQVTTYGYDKAAPYIDTACGKVPLLQSTVKCVVPYARPSINLADKIVDAALGLASKPSHLVQGAFSSISTRVVDCKAAALTKVWYARDIASGKLYQCKTQAVEAFQKYKSLSVEKSSTVLRAAQRYKASCIDKIGQLLSRATIQLHALATKLRLDKVRDMCTTKFEQVSSWTHKKLHVSATRLHLIDLRDAAYCKRDVWKKSLIDLSVSASCKGRALKDRLVATLETIPGKSYLLAARLVGKARMDSVLESAAKYVPWKDIREKQISGSKMVEKKRQ